MKNKNPKRRARKTKKNLPFKKRFWEKWQSLLPVAKYAGGFVALVFLFYVAYSSAFAEAYIVGPVVNVQTHVASFMLDVFGQNAFVQNGLLTDGGDIALNVAKGCDGMEPLALFVIGVLLVPFNSRSKMAGLAWGIGTLFLLNLVRIVGLYFSQAHFPAAFEFLHLHGGFALFTGATRLLWLAWANWAMKRRAKTMRHV